MKFIEVKSIVRAGLEDKFKIEKGILNVESITYATEEKPVPAVVKQLKVKVCTQVILNNGLHLNIPMPLKKFVKLLEKGGK